MKYQNEVIKCLYERASVRSFKDQKIDSETLETILNAGCHAATGGNLQPYSIIKIENEETKKELMNTNKFQGLVGKAPLNLLFVIDFHRIEKWVTSNKGPFIANKSYRHFWIAFQDTIIAAQNICTAADSLGLGSVYIGTVESCFDELKDIFKLPEKVFPVVLLSLGYPKTQPKVAPKLMSDIIVHNEYYHDLSKEVINKAMDKKYSERLSTNLKEADLKELFEVTKKVHGEDFANETINYSKELGYIHPAQRYFGLHYSADSTAIDNNKFISSLLKYDFPWISGKNFPE